MCEPRNIYNICCMDFCVAVDFMFKMPDIYIYIYFINKCNLFILGALHHILILFALTVCTSDQFYSLHWQPSILPVFRAEVKTILAWQNSIEEDLRTKLKEPLLVRICHQIILYNNCLKWRFSSGSNTICIVDINQINHFINSDIMLNRVNGLSRVKIAMNVSFATVGDTIQYVDQLLLSLPAGCGGVLNSPCFCFFPCRKLGHRSWVIPLTFPCLPISTHLFQTLIFWQNVST